MMRIIKSIVVWLIALVFITVFFPLTLIGWLASLPFDRKRALTHWLLVYQSVIITYLLPIWRLKIEGREKLVKGTTYMIISNHQSILDILLLNCIRYRYKWIAKIEIERMPFIGWYLRMAKYITVNRGDDESKEIMLGKALAELKGGTSIMIFPEGTRSLDRQIGFFKRGAFKLAIEAGVPILPVLIDGAGDILPKHGLLMGDGFMISIKILDPVMPADFSTDSPEELAQRFQQYYSDQLNMIRNNR
jgi:1-acyl-sn-glycerol-3-phosphate acyltransferase